MLLREFVQEARTRLSALYGEREAASIVTSLCEAVLGIPGYTSVIYPEIELDPVKQSCLSDCLARLCKYEPLQYVLGRAEFCGLEFNVSPAVLIPRPETEFLCRILMDETIPSACRESPAILDLCTGSGCIAWTLAHYVPNSDVIGADFSRAALEVAGSQNIPGNSPRFVEMDVLSSQEVIRKCLGNGKFDLVVSNPPYVTESEKRLMLRNVLDYEPESALFVPDDDPLLFYRAVADISRTFLAAGGAGAVETNEAFAGDAAELFADRGFRDVHVVQDLSGRDRFVFFRKP